MGIGLKVMILLLIILNMNVLKNMMLIKEKTTI